MNLADKIIALRKQKGWSQEELAEKLDVSRQSVSKWEMGLSVPELQKILAMSELFSVSTDALLKEDPNADAASADPKPLPTDSCRSVSAEEAQRYLKTNRFWAKRIALGVGMCILSPVLLLLLIAFAEQGSIPENTAVAGGLGGLFLLIAGAVTLFVLAGFRLIEYEYLETESILLPKSVIEAVEIERRKGHLCYLLCNVLGILFCLLSPLPLILFAVLEKPDFALLCCVCVLLCCCAVGVFLLVWHGVIEGGYQRLLQTGDYSKEKKSARKRIEPWAAVYWPLITAVYLAVSFLTERWNLTWIIWIGAGCLFPLISLLFSKKQ